METTVITRHHHHSQRHPVLVGPRQSFGSWSRCRWGGYLDSPDRSRRRGVPDCYWLEYPDAPRAPFPLCFTPAALESLLTTVGQRLPETGAKGYGPKDGVGLDVVEFDRIGSSNGYGNVYAPDVEWSEGRRQFHLEQPDDRVRLWTADIHSHPANIGRPSGRAGRGLGDLGYAELVFEQNEWMEWFLIPILTGTTSGEVVIHPWMVHRSDPLRPVLADGVRICSAERFPERSFNPEWLSALEAPAPPAAPVVRRHRAHVAAPDRAALEQDYVARLAGVVSPLFRAAHIMVVGVGAGSHMVEKLARLYPAGVTLCDMDVVEVSNLSRTVYTAADALERRPKVEALAERLLAINPLMDVRTCQRDITALSESELDELFDGVDLVVAGTDQFVAQALVNEQTVARGIPAVFIGIFRLGFGGRVIAYIPGRSGCYRCAAPERYHAFEADGQGALDLEGAAGTIMDSQLVDMVALKLLVGILESGEPSVLGGYLDGCGSRTDLIVRCDPRFEFGRMLWDSALADLPDDQSGQLHGSMLHAQDTVWLENPPQADCPICGSPDRPPALPLEG